MINWRPSVKSRARSHGEASHSGDRHEQVEGVWLAAGDGAGRGQLLSAQQSRPQPGGAGDREDAKQGQLSGIVGATGGCAAKG